MHWLLQCTNAAKKLANVHNRSIARCSCPSGGPAIRRRTSFLGGSRRRKAWYGVHGALRYSAASAKVKLLMGGRSLSASPRNVCAHALTQVRF